jgi:hypothetical protein
MNNNTSQNEGMWDRLSAGWTGVKTAASNIGATAAGTPAKVTNVQDAKIKQLFQTAQSRMKPFVKNLNSTNIATKTAAEIEVKKQLLGFLRDFMKMTGETKANNVIATLQQPQYKDIADYLSKIGVTAPVAPTPSAPTAKTAKTSTKGVPPDRAKFNNKTYDAKSKLWIDDGTKKPLNKLDSNKTTINYFSAIKAGHIIPENSTNISYKEFFV